MPEASHIVLDELPSLAGMPSISLEEMDGIKLMNRIDSKYVTTERVLIGILDDARKAGYRVLVTENAKISPYDSIYYDTAGLKMYTDHHNGRLVRQKVRTRSYVNSGVAFLEIKRKSNKGRTRKVRTAIPVQNLADFKSDASACRYLETHSDFTADELSLALETHFLRVTLVNPTKTERLTIDTQLAFRNLRTSGQASLYDAVVIELKQDGHAASQMKGILLDHRVHPLRVSKYCTGVTLTDPSAKTNRFKPKVRAIEKIINKKLMIK